MATSVPSYLDSLGSGFKNARSAAYVTPGGNAGANFAPGGIIPASQFDPNSMAILKLFPKGECGSDD